MPVIMHVKGVYPSVGRDCFLAPNATIVGDVVMGNECSVWFNAVIRGDVNAIRLGDRVNVQDGAVIHCTYQRTATQVGNNVSIGSNATILPVFICNDVVIGAGSVVTKDIDERGIYAGNPAVKIKDL